MSQSGYVTLEACDIVRTTDRAILVCYDGDDIWFPKACVADPESFRDGWKNVTVMVTEAIARQKGIGV